MSCASCDPNVTFRKKIPTAPDVESETASERPHDSNIQHCKKITVPVDAVSNTEPDLSLPTEIRSLRQEVSLLRDQLSKAVVLISSYETKLESYSSQVEALHVKFLNCEVNYSAVGTTPNQTQPKDSLPKKVALSLESSKPKQKKTQIHPTPRPAHQLGSRKPTQLSTVSKKPSGIESDMTPVSCSTPSHQESKNQLPWTEVRRNRRPTSLCGTAGPTVTSLKAVEPRSYIHLWNMESSADEIRDYLRQLCPEGTCTVVELATKGDYKSYKIGVPVAYHDTCLSIEVWPVNARIKTWINYNRRPTGLLDPLKPNQPFRGATASR